MSNEKYYIDRFLSKHNYYYETAIKELRNGHKESHWMWYIFPQLRGLGNSRKSFIYGIASINEAKEYLNDPVLKSRLKECCEALLLHDKSAEEMLGDIDAKKLCSCMTLFMIASDSEQIFCKVLDKFFDGKADPKTTSVLTEHNGFFIKDGVLRAYCGKECDVVVPNGVTAIGDMAFYKRNDIHSVSLPDSVESIGDRAFVCCKNLRSVKLQQSLTDIGACAFCACDSLADDDGFVVVNNILFDYYNVLSEIIYIPKDVTTISSYALSKYLCNTKYVMLPQGVTTIMAAAFYFCEDMTVYIPKSTTKIALDAFSECKNITIHSYKNSCAQSYAHKMGIAFEED